MLMCFQDKIAENPSFEYAMWMDCEEQIAIILCIDIKNALLLCILGDVVSFTLFLDKTRRIDLLM